MEMRAQFGAIQRLRALPCVLMLCLSAPPAFAQAPDAIIQRIVELNIQETEGLYLRNSRQIDDNTFNLRHNAASDELKALWKQIRQLPAGDQQQATSRIDGLTKARRATLEPQWQAKAEQSRRQRDQHERMVIENITADARAALEPQRRRLLLQQRRDRGEITAEDFAAQDKKALDEIMALRSKYASEGQSYMDRFDNQLAQMTQAIAKNPAPEPIAKTPPTPAPVPKANAVPGKVDQTGTSATDYRRDIEQAAMIQYRRKEASDRYNNKEIDLATYSKSEKVSIAAYERLYQKWVAAGRKDDFQRDYRQRLAAMSLPARKPARRNEAAKPQIGLGSAFAIVNGVRLVAMLVFFALVGLIAIGLLWLLFGKKPAGRRLSTVHGTAHYAALELDVKDEMCVWNGLFFGKSSAPERRAAPVDAPGAPVCATPEHHTLIVARTRTGKGTRVIVPTLLRYGGSALVIDPKGENAAITARIRQNQLHQNIHILNPWNELAETYRRSGFSPATYNPLDILVRSDPNAVAIAQTLAGAICPAPANAKDRFWQGNAANILTAVLLWLADQPDEKKTLGRAREIVSLSRKDFTAKYLTRMAASEAFSFAIREMAAPFIDLADETYSGVMSNLSESTRFLSDPQIKAATANSSFTMDDLATGKATVYVVIPTERMDTQKTWLRLVIAAAMHSFKHPKANLQFGHRCLFLIDEFAALGRMDDLPRDIATMSGYGVDFALIVQGLDQLKDHYGEARGAILSNCAYKWFCNVNDLDSAKYLSDTLGKATVGTVSTSDTSSSGNRNSSQGHSTTYGETGRSLLNPDEILNLGRDVAITIQPYGHAHYLRPVDYWNLPVAFGALRKRHPAFYWNPPLAYDENPYFAAPIPPPLPRDGSPEKAVLLGE